MFIRFENKVADAYINRGFAYQHLKDTTAAYENYDTAVRTNSPGRISPPIRTRFRPPTQAEG